MTVAITTPLTGAAQTGFTTPAYVLTADSAVDSNIKQLAVTGLTGTQAGVRSHSVSDPFLISVAKPKTFQGLPKANPVTGLISNVPKNVYKFNVVKGVLPAANQPASNASVSMEIRIPAGSDSYDAPNIRAMLSAAIGALSQVSAGLGDSTINGIL